MVRAPRFNTERVRLLGDGGESASTASLLFILLSAILHILLLKM
jgi:hypothetical protein